MTTRQQSYLISIALLFCQPLFAQVPLELQPPSGPETVQIQADRQQRTGNVYHMQGNVVAVYRTMKLTADQGEYNAQTGELTAQGNLHYTNTLRHEDIYADHAVYYVNEDTGQFYEVHGSVGGVAKPKPGMLTTSNPFYFSARRVDQLEPDVYLVYNGWVTVCSPPHPTWTFRARLATIYNGEDVRVEHAEFRLLGVPLFYFPYFYHSIEQEVRKSGFLMPMAGESSIKGFFIGDSFYWAINRSMDAEIGAEYLSARGSLEKGLYRARFDNGAFLEASYFGVVDRLGDGGESVHAVGQTPLPDGFSGILDFSYLSSLTFRETFSQTYSEAINSEVHSSGDLTKDFGPYSFNTLFSQVQDFYGLETGNVVDLRALPEFQFQSVQQPLWKDSPLLFSWDSSFGLLDRIEPVAPYGTGLNTGPYEREVFDPQVSLPVNFGWLHLTASVGYHFVEYSEQRDGGTAVDQPLTEGATTFTLNFHLPTLEKLYDTGPFKKHPFRHAIEPFVTYSQTSGIRDFSNVILFDENDLVTDTQQIEYGVTQRFYVKDANGLPRDLFDWELKEEYYFDPTFGGALVAGQRNVILDSLELSGNSFLFGPRRFSPIVSEERFHPLAHYDLDLREDWDPVLHEFTRLEATGSAHWSKAFVNLNETLIHTTPILSPTSDMLSITTGYGNLLRKGFNVAVSTAYDIHDSFAQYVAVQGSYNNNCCGIAFEVRRFYLGTARDENQYLVSFSLANIGSFGTLTRQERLF